MLPTLVTQRIRRVLPGADRCRVLGLLVLGLVAMWRLGPWRAGLMSDAQVYFFISEQVASGVPPHVSEFDPKNALSMFLSGLAIWGGRFVGADDVMAARALSIAVTAAVFPLLWSVCRRLGGTPWMARAAVLLPLLFPEFLYLAVVGANPKIFLMFFEVLWMLAATFDAPFVLGLLTAACFLTWQPALLLLAAAGTALLLRNEGRRKAVALLLAGFVLPVVAYEGYFLWHGALGDQLYQALVFPAEYSRKARSLLGGTYAVLQLKQRVGVTSVLLCAYFVLLAGCWLACVLSPRRAWPWFRGRPDRAALLLGASGTLAFSFVDFQGFADRLFFFPFLAVVVGAAIGAVLDAAGAGLARMFPDSLRQRRLPAMAGSALFVAVALALVVLRIPDRGSRRDLLEGQRAAAADVARIARKGRSIYAMGPLHLLAMNRLGNFNRFGFFPVRVTAYMNRRLAAEKHLLPLRDGKLPDVLLQTRSAAPGSAMWIKRYYRRSHSSALDRERVRLWRLRKGAKPPPDASAM